MVRSAFFIILVNLLSLGVHSAASVNYGNGCADLLPFSVDYTPGRNTQSYELETELLKAVKGLGFVSLEFNFEKLAMNSEIRLLSHMRDQNIQILHQWGGYRKPGYPLKIRFRVFTPEQVTYVVRQSLLVPDVRIFELGFDRLGTEYGQWLKIFVIRRILKADLAEAFELFQKNLNEQATPLELNFYPSLHPSFDDRHEVLQSWINDLKRKGIAVEKNPKAKDALKLILLKKSDLDYIVALATGQNLHHFELIKSAESFGPNTTSFVEQ